MKSATILLRIITAIKNLYIAARAQRQVINTNCLAAAIVATFWIAAAVGPVTIATPAVIQNVGSRNNTMGRNLAESLIISEQRGIYSEHGSNG